MVVAFVLFILPVVVGLVLRWAINNLGPISGTIAVVVCVYLYIWLLKKFTGTN